ncbi:carbohydrate ABC transporter permease, partial [Streptococcus agalactiae]
VAFHYRSYGTFFLHKNRLYKSYRGFTHYKYYRATTLYIAVITTINSFQCFALIQLLTSGGPNYSTSTLMYYLYEKAFKLSEYGYANTMGVFLAVMIALISFAQFKILGNDVEY